MEKYDVQSWTVEKERQLYEDELQINWEISVSYDLSKGTFFRSVGKSLVSIYYIYPWFWQRKQAQKICKLKSNIKYDNWILKIITNKQDIVDGILENCEGSESMRITLSGDKNIPQLTRKFFNAFMFAWTRASANLKISLSNFWLLHKQFWRMTFAMRHINQIQMHSCRLIELRWIHDKFQIIGFSPTDISFIFSQFISSKTTFDKKEACLLLIESLQDLQEKIIQPKGALYLSLNLLSTNKGSSRYYVRQEKE